MKKLFNFLGAQAYTFSKNYLLSIVVFGVLGILAAVTGHYGLMGFNPFAFFVFELPLYIFLIWAITKVFGNYYVYHKDECNTFMDIFDVNEPEEKESCENCDKN